MFVMPIARAAHRHAYNGHDLSRVIDRLFDSAFEAKAETAAPTPREPALDIRETDASYTVQIDMPGVTKEDVRVSIEGKRVSIEATASPTARAAEGERLLVRERRAAAYVRAFTLPVEVDESTSQARLDHGVLNLTLAKKAKAALQIQVN